MSGGYCEHCNAPLERHELERDTHTCPGKVEARKRLQAAFPLRAAYDQARADTDARPVLAKRRGWFDANGKPVFPPEGV